MSNAVLTFSAISTTALQRLRSLCSVWLGLTPNKQCENSLLVEFRPKYGADSEQFELFGSPSPSGERNPHDAASGATLFYFDGIDGHGPHGAFGIADADTAVGLAARDGAVFPTFGVAATESNCGARRKANLAQAVSGEWVGGFGFLALRAANRGHD